MYLTKILSLCFGYLANIRFPYTLQIFINKVYIRLFNINIDDFMPLESYKSLNELFTRSLKKSREFSNNKHILISPSDSKIIESGIVDNNIALQIKGMNYSVNRLLDSNLDSNFYYINLYLSPKDYHRYHAPCDMLVESITHYKGALYPVHIKSLNKNANLFIRNERVVLKAIDSFGDVIYFVAIGALNVGQIVFHIEPRLQDSYSGNSIKFSYNIPIFIKKGEELGMFKMGSTIVLFISNIDLIYKDDNVLFGDTLARKRV